MKKIKISLILVLNIFSIMLFLLSGCNNTKNEVTLHRYHYSNKYKNTSIIYEVKSTPTEIIDNKYYWKKDNVQLEFKFGIAQNNSCNDCFSKPIIIGYELLGFGVYIYNIEKINDKYNYLVKDYKNIDNAILLNEISTEDFLSDKYKANYVKQKNPPIFNPSNDWYKITLTEEIYGMTIDNNKKCGKFRFGVTPIYKLVTNEYYIEFGSYYDGLNFEYFYFEDNNDKLIISCDYDKMPIM